MSENQDMRAAVERMANRVSRGSKGQLTYDQAKKIAVDTFKRNERGAVKKGQSK